MFLLKMVLLLYLTLYLLSILYMQNTDLCYVICTDQLGCQAVQRNEIVMLEDHFVCS